MNRKEFKKSLKEVLSEYDFQYKDKIYNLTTDDLIIVIATQKSNFDNNYYLNYGFLIRELNPNLSAPRDNQCDVFGRFELVINRKKNNSIEIESIDPYEFSLALRKCLDEIIKPVLEFGLKKYFELYPMEINVTTLNARKYLGLL